MCVGGLRVEICTCNQRYASMRVELVCGKVIVLIKLLRLIQDLHEFIKKYKINYCNIYRLINYVNNSVLCVNLTHTPSELPILTSAAHTPYKSKICMGIGLPHPLC